MKKQIQFKIRSKWCLALFLAVFSITTYGQQSVGDPFTVDGIRYEITSTAPTEVEVVGYTGTAKEVTTPSNVKTIERWIFSRNQ